MPSRTDSPRAASVATTSSIGAVEGILRLETPARDWIESREVTPYPVHVKVEVPDKAENMQYYVSWYSLQHQEESSKPNKTSKPIPTVGTFCMSSGAPLAAFRDAVSAELRSNVTFAPGQLQHYELYYRYYKNTKPLVHALPAGDAGAYRAMLDTLRRTLPLQRHIEIVVRQVSAATGASEAIALPAEQPAPVMEIKRERTEPVAAEPPQVQPAHAQDNAAGYFAILLDRINEICGHMRAIEGRVSNLEAARARSI